MPGLEVRCLGGTDTEQNAQHFGIGHALRQRWVEAGAARFDKGEVETCRISDCLDVIAGSEIAIVSGNGRKLPLQQTWDGRSERVAEIWVLVATAVPCPVRRVDGELHKVC